MTTSSVQTAALLRSFLAGSALALASLLLAVVFGGPKHGYEDNPAHWPAEARAVLAEKPGQALTQEQWARINRALNSASSKATIRRGFLAELAGAWYLLLAFPAAAAVLQLALGRQRAIPQVLVLLSPAVLLLALAVAGSRL